MIKGYWVYSLSILCGAILFIILICIYQKLSATDIVLIITAIIIFNYTYETYKLRRATVDHTEIYTRPVLIFRIKPNNRSQDVLFWLHNFGNSPAYNVEFQQTEFIANSAQWRLKLGNVGVVPPGDKIEVSLEETLNETEHDRVSSGELFKFINSARIRRERYSLKTTAIYDDILGHSRKSALGFSSTAGIIVKKPELVKKRSNK